MRTDKPHIWHMEMIAKLCAADPEILIAMPVFDLQDGRREFRKCGNLLD